MRVFTILNIENEEKRGYNFTRMNNRTNRRGKTTTIVKTNDAMANVLSRNELIDYVNDLISKDNPFAYFFVDFDNFKKVNDTLGHQAGDRALFLCVEFLQKSKPAGSIVARYGGDEFVLVCPFIQNYDDTWQIARNFCQYFRNHPQPFLSGIYHEGTITITAGVSRFPLDGKNFEELNSAADKALYKGKTKGKDCFVIYDQKKHGNIKTDSRDMELSVTDVVSKIFTLFETSDNAHTAFDDGVKWLGDLFKPNFIVLLSPDQSCLLLDQELEDESRYLPYQYDSVFSEMDKSLKIFRFSEVRKASKDVLYQQMEASKIHSFVAVRIKEKDDVSLLLFEFRRERQFLDHELAAFLVFGRVYSMKLKYEK